MSEAKEAEEAPSAPRLLKFIVALSIIAILLGAASAGVAMSLQSSVSSISAEIGQLRQNINQVAEAVGLPLGNPEELQKVLAAKKEGVVIVYGSLESETMKGVVDAFEKKYGVKVEYWRAYSTGVLDRVLTEVKAGNPHFDVVLTNRAPMLIMKKEQGSFASYISPEAKNYPDEAKDPDGVLQPYYRLTAIGLLYNTNLVKPEDAPKTLQDLLDPKWKGKIVIPDPSQHTTTTAWLFNLKKVLGADWETFIKGLGNQQPTLVKSFLPSVEMVIRGEKPMGITYIKYVKVFEKAPLDYSRFGTTLGEVHSVGLGAKAAHPNAAKLFIDFLLSRDSLNILAQSGEFMTLPGMYPPIKDSDKLKIVFMDELTDQQFREYGRTFAKWLAPG